MKSMCWDCHSEVTVSVEIDEGWPFICLECEQARKSGLAPWTEAGKNRLAKLRIENKSTFEKWIAVDLF